MMKGLVLCGGQSSRMGHDKGLKTLAGHSWAQHASRLLHTVTCSVLYAVNASQMAEYSLQQKAGLTAEAGNLLMDNDVLPVYGPLKGILSAHLAFPDADWLVMACDMILMQTEALQYLCTQAALYTAATAVVYGNQQQAQPLCGIYTSKGLGILLQQVQNGGLKKSSMHQALAMLHTEYIAIPEHLHSCFINCNTPEDVVAIAAMVSVQS
ncbi:molybdopterin-guanine dinucleotide biosynthesis protein A [Filimonas zeae]|uniref:Molybdenum cofactor guanylyltransferase n=1 Tax=Filimonas zeae TaxID=1737353 RepID=A0A917J297_9BACT|nr:molybdenum cofactor guanylyltransferase [Filimonas zeae]MDR6340294.1 molybdopterin-guanine dinucleotide biosynthesis protein A [Filimonas zeae]GGH72056.1 molybdenum cofactor guanylyltransferase [Filimonas zeae]